MPHVGGEKVKPDKAGKLATDSYNLGTAHALVRRVVLDAQELQVALGPFMCEDTKRDLAQLKSAASRISARVDRAQIDNVKAAMTRPIPQEGRR